MHQLQLPALREFLDQLRKSFVELDTADGLHTRLFHAVRGDLFAGVF